jgi:hypothetical protein
MGVGRVRRKEEIKTGSQYREDKYINITVERKEEM